MFVYREVELGVCIEEVSDREEGSVSEAESSALL
jgi:hypothetical protein